MALRLTLTLGLGLAIAQQFNPHMVVRSNFSMNKVSGTWYSIAMASNNLSRIQKSGDLRAFIQNIESFKNDSLKFNFFFKLLGQCEPVTLLCDRTDRKGWCIINYEGETFVRIVETIYKVYITFYLRNLRGEDRTRMLVLYGRVPELSPIIQDRFKKICQKLRLAPENIIKLNAMDIC